MNTDREEEQQKDEVLKIMEPLETTESSIQQPEGMDAPARPDGARSRPGQSRALKKTRKLTMDTDREEEQRENEVLKIMEPLRTTEVIIQQQPASLQSEITKRQHQLLENLRRLHHSLRGPEELLDRTGYSRPFPPKNKHHEERHSFEAEKFTNDPFSPFE